MTSTDYKAPNADAKRRYSPQAPPIADKYAGRDNLTIDGSCVRRLLSVEAAARTQSLGWKCVPGKGEPVTPPAVSIPYPPTKDNSFFLPPPAELDSESLLPRAAEGRSLALRFRNSAGGVLRASPDRPFVAAAFPV